LPAPTIAQSSNQLGARGGILHPEEDRTYTVREMKRLFALPDDPAASVMDYCTGVLKRATALKEVKRLCKEFCFTAGMLKGALAEGRQVKSDS
jgi:hypothetical protein